MFLHIPFAFAPFPPLPPPCPFDEWYNAWGKLQLVELRPHSFDATLVSEKMQEAEVLEGTSSVDGASAVKFVDEIEKDPTSSLS